MTQPAASAVKFQNAKIWPDAEIKAFVLSADMAGSYPRSARSVFTNKECFYSTSPSHPRQAAGVQGEAWAPLPAWMWHPPLWSKVSALSPPAIPFIFQTSFAGDLVKPCSLFFPSGSETHLQMQFSNYRSTHIICWCYCFSFHTHAGKGSV